jgi:hypothetical protein
MKSGHFLEFYTAGGGIDESEDTPSVTGGTCLKIK